MGAGGAEKSSRREARGEESKASDSSATAASSWTHSSLPGQGVGRRPGDSHPPGCPSCPLCTGQSMPVALRLRICSALPHCYYLSGWRKAGKMIFGWIRTCTHLGKKEQGGEFHSSPGQVGSHSSAAPATLHLPLLERTLGQDQREGDAWGPSGPQSALCRGVPCHVPSPTPVISPVYFARGWGCLFQMEAFGGHSSKSLGRGLMGSRCQLARRPIAGGAWHG